MLKQKILNHEKTIGMHLNLNDIAAGKMAGLSGFDFIWIDMEHSYLSYEGLLNLIIAIQGVGGKVIVRAPQDDFTATKKILEMGPDGIIFPMVKTAEQANRLISYTLYPPYGNRGFGPWNAVDFGIKDIWDYVRNNHKTMCRFIQIEHIDAVNNLDEIIKNEYIDGYIIGANDLSGSVNRLGDAFSDEVISIIKDVIKKLKASNKYVGISTGDYSEETLKYFHDLGFDMISAGADFDFLRDGMKKCQETLKRAHLGL